MKKTLLSLLAVVGVYASNAQCNNLIFEQPTEDISFKTCNGQSLILYSYATGGTNIQYTYYKDGNVISSPSLSNTFQLDNIAPMGAGTYYAQVTSNECPTGVTSPYVLHLQVDTAIPPAASTQFSSYINPCVGTINTYGVGVINPTDYNWTWNIPTGWSGSSNTASITLTVADTASSVWATATNGCGSRDYGFNFVRPIGNTIADINAINLHYGTLCQGNEVYFSVDAVPGERYTWEFPEDWIQTPYSVEGISIAEVHTSGTITVTATSACSSDTVTYSQNFTINPIPETPIITQVGNTLQTTVQTYIYHWYEYSANSYYDTVIIGTSGMVYIPTDNSTYVLLVEDESGCWAESEPFEFTGFVGINGVEENAFSIYPNPASNYIFIDAEQATNIALTDMQGKVVYAVKDAIGKQAISTQNMANGAYLVHTTKGNKQSTTKLLIAK